MSRNGTRIDAVMGEIKSRIASRTYTPGARIPSVRAMARALQVSVSTVLEAYERLMAEGLLNSRPGSGFYVAGPVAPLVLTELAPRLDREVDPLWISRQSLETASDAMKPHTVEWSPPSGRMSSVYWPGSAVASATVALLIPASASATTSSPCRAACWAP